MKETDMTEYNQIRERFLADARLHFLADDTGKPAIQRSTLGDDERSYSNSCQKNNFPA